jgi:hypothetical protein
MHRVRDSGLNDSVMMTAQEEDRELRSELQKITETSGFNQVADIAALRKTPPHSISFVTESSEQPHGYNCFMYALGLVVLPDRLVALARQHEDAFPSARFMARLVERGLQNISASDAEDGDLVIYFDAAGNAKHAGIVQGGYVVSKWGTGHIWKHQLFEIPASYGVEARFYRRIDRDEVLRLFEAFAQEVVGNRSAAQPPLVADDGNHVRPTSQ